MIVGRHPSEEDESAPIMAKMREDERPNRSFAEDLLPGNAANRTLQMKAAQVDEALSTSLTMLMDAASTASDRHPPGLQASQNT